MATARKMTTNEKGDEGNLFNSFQMHGSFAFTTTTTTTAKSEARSFSRRNNIAEKSWRGNDITVNLKNNKYRIPFATTGYAHQHKR